MALVRWRFDDTTDSTFAVFEVNPNADGSPVRSRTLTAHNTLAVGGKDLIFEGSQDPLQITFSGLILSTTMLDMLTLWFGKRHQIQLTDDLGRVQFVMITKFTPKRVRASKNFWKHSYDCSATVVDWP